jgi:uncharacterized protein YidB (DUF937 family)
MDRPGPKPTDCARATWLGPRPGLLKTLAQQTGLPEQELLSHLSQILPGVVDKLTPNNRLPTKEEAAKFH